MQKSVEEYLSEVEKQLSSLPAELRASELRELRLHIEQLIETFVGDGQSEEDATNSALEQFGPPKALCQGLKQAHSQPPWIWARLCLSLLAAVVTEICIYGSYPSIMKYSGINQPSNWAYLWGYAQVFSSIFMLKTIFLLSGFVAGWVAETIAPRRAICSLFALCGLRIAFVVANNHSIDYRALITFGTILLAGYCGIRLRQWQLKRRQVAIMC